MLPCREPDIADWPIRVSELAEHYTAAAELTGLSARRDDLEGLYRLYLREPAALDLSRQARILLNRLERRRGELARAGVHFGQARLAVQAARPLHSNGCVYCGLCMYGCPFGYIYNSDTTLQQLQQHSNFSYERDIVVTTVRELSDGVVVEDFIVSLAIDSKRQRSGPISPRAQSPPLRSCYVRCVATIRTCG